MNRHQLLSDLYHRALECAPGERRAFLHEACDGDPALREEVESLLRYESDSAQFLERPAALASGVGALGASQSSMVNRQIGSYTIVAPLGVGGMGEVYRAHDTKLGRDVAIKILPPHFTSDPERRARFAREARLLATLNHPHIGAIYGLEEADGITALVLELVEGPTLADRLERGPLTLPEALTFARQIAEALEAAHEKGIVHRDLKPANIVLQGSSGSAGEMRAKVLDFGLAKPTTTGVAAEPTQGASSPFAGTVDGRILGTPAYMSPEQARGLAVDRRTDLWAFGCVLFEMLTGRRAFPGDTVTDTLASILEREPDWAALPAETPASMRRLLERCLRKDPRKRLHDIADALIEIDDATQPVAVTGTSADVTSPASGRNRRRLGWIAGGIGAGVVLTFLSLALVPRDPVSVPDESKELAIAAPPGTRFDRRGSIVTPFALAPDGRHIAFTGRTGDSAPTLWVRSLGSSEARQLPGTGNAVGPFWSPDGRRIAFFADGKLKAISVNGGPASEICDAPGLSNYGGGSWNQDDVIIFRSTEGPLYRVASAGGTPTAVTALQEGDAIHAGPWFLPDGQHFLFLALGSRRPQLRIGSLTSSESVAVGSLESRAVYAAGYLLFVDARGVMAQPFDAASRRLSGEPIVLTERPPHRSPFLLLFPFPGDVLSVADRGLLAYRAAPMFETQLTWMDRKGNPVGTVGNPGGYVNLSLSPDDRQLAVSGLGPDGIDIWVIDLIRNDKKRLTTTAATEFDPTWSPDGKFVIFQSNRFGFLSLFRRPSDGSGRDALVAKGEAGRGYIAPEWSPDGRFLISNGGGDLWVHSVDGESKASPFLATQFTEGSGAFSPDGRFVVYSSDQTGRPEIYVRPFPSGDREYKISRDGGRYPRWRIDTEIVFLSPDGTLMSARVSGGQPVPGITPRPLFRTALGVGNQKPYDVSKDGQRFLIPVARESDEPELITIITNWTARLRR